MRNLTFGDFNFDSNLRGVMGGTVSLYPGEGYLIVADKKKSNRPGENPIVVAVAGSNEELLREKAKYERNKRYVVSYAPDTTEQEDDAEDQLMSYSEKVPEHLLQDANYIASCGVEFPSGNSAEEVMVWSDAMRPFYRCDEMKFRSIAATFVMPAAFMVKAGKVSQYILDYDFANLTFKEKDRPIAVSLFQCLDRDFIVGWIRDGKPIICYVHIDADYEARIAQITACSYTEYSEKTEDFLVVPHTLRMKTGQTIDQAYEAGFSEMASIADVAGINSADVIAFMKRNLKKKGDAQIYDDLLHAFYLIVENNIEPYAILNVDIDGQEAK